MEKHKPVSSPLGYLGFGLGLRTCHYEYILEHTPSIDWFEIVSENYLVDGGKPLYYLDQINERYPLVMHGVSLNIGSCDPINYNYLAKLRKLIHRVQPHWVSDHLCWTGVNHINTHDLLPLPYTEEVVQHVTTRVKKVQEYLDQQILLENPSTYVDFSHSTMTEWQCLNTIAKEADCLILLDINNIYVNAYNHQFDPYEYINHIPIDRVQQIHLAGHTNYTEHIIDTHDAPIIDPVWKLYRHAVARFGKVSTMIERDDHIPEFPELMKELDIAKEINQDVLSPVDETLVI